MKKFLLFITTTFIVQSILAQEHDPIEISIDSMLINIDKTELTSRVLYERVFPWAHLDTVNQLDGFVAHKDYFEQALYELYLASNQEKFMSYTDLRKIYASDSLQNVVDLGVINASFHTLNYNPENEEEGALHIVDSLFQKIENGEPVFLLHHVFIVSPLKRFLKAKGSQKIIYHILMHILHGAIVKGFIP